MKKIATILLYLIFSLLTLNAQKILFDCTRGESASNADWVIDADSHDLKSNWPTTTGGTESDPQQIPTPAQSNITTSTSETFWDGAISSWGIDLVKYNSAYTIETLPYNAQITYGNNSNSQDLSNYKVYILDEPNSLFTSAEKTAIVQFVQNGGGLFIISDHNQADRNGDGEDAVSVLNDLLTSSSGFNNDVGITYEANNISELPSTNINTNLPSTDPLLYGSYGTVNSLKYNNGSSMAINTSNNSSVKAVIYCDTSNITGTTGVLMAYATYGNGKIVALGDSSPIDDGTGDSGDNLYVGWGYSYNSVTSNANLAMNATIWLLTDSNSPHLTTSTNSLSGFSYITGNGPSSSQSFSLSGSNLDGSQVSISAPADYEISVDNSNFSSSLNISYTAPTLSDTTIYVRLKSGLSVATYNNETITCSDNGSASDVTVSNNGEVKNTISGNGIVINEIAANPGGSYTNEYVELYNDGTSDVDLNGYKLIIKRSGKSDVNITIGTTGTDIGGTTISSGGYFVITRGTVSSSPRIEYGNFYLNKSLNVILEDASSNQVDAAGSNYEFNPGDNYELCSPSIDNAIFSNWTDQGSSFAGTPGALNSATCASSATLNISPVNLSGFSYIFGHGPSNSQTFTLSGSNLDGSQVSISAPADYEISVDNSNFYSSLNISYTAPTLSDTTIYVRLKSGLSVATYNNETITCSDNGSASAVTVSNNGEVLQSTISVSQTSLSGFSYTLAHGPSSSQTFSLSGSNLDGSQVSISAPADYEISVDNSNFSSSLNISYTAPTLSDTTIYVRLKSGLSVATYNNEIITCSDNGNASAVSVSNNGEVKAASASCATDLIISEVIESGSDKYVEIANFTGARVNLANYDIAIYSNGNTSPSNIILLGDTNTIADQSVFVISYLGSDNWSGTVDTSSGALSFNGNDVIALRKNSTNMDVFGTIGSADYFNDDKRVLRSAFVTSPSTSYNSSDWDFYDYSGEDPSSLGTHNMSCICETPSVQASNISFSSITTNSLNLSWTNGNGLNRIVVVKKGNPVDWSPTDNTSYPANSSFATGTELGTGNYIIYNGSQNTASITNLTPATNYYFKIYEYNCQPGSEHYFTTGTPAEANTTSSPEDISNFQLICGTGSQAELSWTLPNGNYDGILITGLQGATPEIPSCNGANLTNPLTDFSAAQTYCSNSSNSVYLFNNIGTEVDISGLNSGSSYTFKAFVYKNSSWSKGKELSFVAKVSDVSNLNTDCGNTTCYLSWTNPNSSCYDEILVVAHASSAVSANPSGDGTSYSADANFGSGTDIGTNEYVVYKGSGESVTITNLNNGTDYYYKVFVRKGSNWSTGTEINCTPTTAIKLDYGDLAIVGINTNIDDAGSSSDDEIQFVCFKAITPQTSIDLTDNGYERLYAGKWGDSEGLIRITRKNTTIAANTLIALQGNGKASNWHVFIGDGSNSQTFVSDDDNWTITDGGTGNDQFNLNSSDQIWMMQGGEWIDPAGAQNATYTGKVLYGWTATGWESAPGYNSTSGSTLFGKSSCSQTNVVGVANQDKVKYNSTITATSQRQWISRFNNQANWKGFSDSTSYFNGGTLPDTISVSGSGFSTTAQWTGETSTDWNDCTNWLNLKVPDKTADVVFIADNCNNDIVVPDGDTIICNNLTIQGSAPKHCLKIEGSSNTVLEINGNLTIDVDSALIFDNGNTSSADGIMKIYGNWTNNAGSAGFLQGNSTVEFKGTSKQTISTSDSQEDFYNLIINNSGTNGVVINKNILISDTIDLSNGILDLNGMNLTISGEYIKTNGIFKGNTGSNLTINGTGKLANFNFSTPQNLNTLTMNRTGQTTELSSNMTMSNLTISSGTVQLDAGKFYTVSNILTNSVGATGLILKSDATGTASLLLYSENIPATCERYISGGIWSYFFSPLTNIPKSKFSSAVALYYYNETAPDYWQNHDSYGTSGWTNEGNSYLSTNKGYIIYFNNSNVYSLSGGNLFFDATNNYKQFSLSYTDSGSGAVNQNGVTTDWDVFEGWNLIGNPFSCAIDWSKVSLNNVDDVIYYYDGTSQNYKYYGTGTALNEGITVNGGSQFVPANQAFFVKASADGATVTIPNSARVHSNSLYLKKNKTLNIADIIKLKVALGKFSDETVIHFNKKSTELHDNIDAYKFFSYNKKVPQIYSIDDTNTKYSINNLPIKNNLKLKLGFYTKDAGIYNIIAEKTDVSNYHIYLKDKLLNKTINIQNNPSYQFYYKGGTDNDRFELIANKNRKPYIVNPLTDYFENANEQFNINLTDNTFADPDLGDFLTYSCSLSDGTNLPKYLSFENGILKGLFSDSASLELTITATDKYGLKSSQNFKLFISEPEKLTETENSFMIYPNPASESIYLYIPQIMPDTRIKIFDATGKLILEKNTSVEKNTLNTSILSSGIYIIEVKNDIINKQQKLIIK